MESRERTKAGSSRWLEEQGGQEEAGADCLGDDYSFKIVAFPFFVCFDLQFSLKLASQSLKTEGVPSKHVAEQ